MEALADVLRRDRRTDDPAVRASGGPSVEYTYDDFVTTAWKTANFFSHRGVHEGATVAVADDHAIPAILALFGAAQLGATTMFVSPPPGDGGRVDADLLVAPGECIEGYDARPGTTRVAYHGQPDDPAVEPFGRSVWSENPVEPPESADPDGPALAFDGGTASHRDLLGEAGDVAESLAPGDEVVVRASLTRREAVVEGVLASVLAGATVVLGADDGDGRGGDCWDGGDPALVVE